MLIKCPECGKDVSSEAHFCPFCGYPVKQYVDQIRQAPRVNESPQNVQPSSNQKEKYTEQQIRTFASEAKSYNSSGGACVVFGLLMFIGGIVMLVLGLAVVEDTELMTILSILGGIIGDVGLVLLTVGGGVNNTKARNRNAIVEDYKNRHPDFKED